TEIMGSSMRSREAISLGETDTRRFSDIIEASLTSGWHSFEQALLKGYEEDAIDEETALLYSVNKTQMRQRLDAVNKRRSAGPTPSSMKMKVEEPRPKPIVRSPAAPPPVPDELKLKPPGEPKFKPPA